MPAIGALTALTLGLAAAVAPLQESCPVLVLERSGESFALNRVVIASGEAQVYLWQGDFVTLVVPWSVGQSGEVVQAVGRRGATVARCEAGTLTLTVQRPDAEPRVLPTVNADSWARFRMRVSVTPGSGSAVAFVVQPDGTIVRDTLGPPTDMFGGGVPLQPRDVAITTETREARRSDRLNGTVPLQRAGAYFTAQFEIASGGTGEAIVDLGASRTLLTREVLPPGVVPVPLRAVEHGASGDREFAGSVGALGGDVGVVGSARLPELRVGSLVFTDVVVNVIAALPELGGRNVNAILGIDLFHRAGFTRIVAAADAPRLELSDLAATSRVDLETPFSLVGGLIVVTGSSNGVTVPFVLDTGARATVLSESSARALDVQRLAGVGDAFRGLDGHAVETWPALIRSLTFAKGSLESLRVNVGTFHVLDRLGMKGGGLLGQDLWSRFTQLEVDWDSSVVRWFQ